MADPSPKWSTEVGAAWASYYRAGMSGKEARAFQAGYAAALLKWAEALSVSDPQRRNGE